MRSFLYALVLAGFVNSAWAQAFPDFLKNIFPQLPVPGGGQQQQQQPQGQPKQGPQSQPQKQPQPQPGGFFADTPIEEELTIGKQLAGTYLGAMPLVKNDKLQAYVNKVGRWLATQSERSDLKWYFGVMDSADINAFSLPGGYVFITMGLYAKLSNEAELAGVLGHEIGHVLMKHHLKVLKQSQLISAVSGLIAREVGKDGETMGLNFLANGAQAMARGLDKESEHEADRIGVVLATRAGYEPYGLPNVLQKIGRVNPNDSAVALLFKTHPSPQERLGRLGDAMGASFDRYAEGKNGVERFASAPR